MNSASGEASQRQVADKTLGHRFGDADGRIVRYHNSAAAAGKEKYRAAAGEYGQRRLYQK
jgi:hypothetical protein